MFWFVEFCTNRALRMESHFKCIKTQDSARYSILSSIEYQVLTYICPYWIIIDMFLTWDPQIWKTAWPLMKIACHLYFGCSASNFKLSTTSSFTALWIFSLHRRHVWFVWWKNGSISHKLCSGYKWSSLPERLKWSFAVLNFRSDFLILLLTSLSSRKIT